MPDQELLNRAAELKMKLTRDNMVRGLQIREQIENEVNQAVQVKNAFAEKAEEPSESILHKLKNTIFSDPVIPQSVERTGIWPYTGNPKEWIDRSDPNYTPSIYADTPRFDVTGVGVINPVMGSAEGVVPMLRRLMASENVSRGKPTGDLLDELSRGIWLHGRGQYPKTGETFAQSRVRTGNLGEPYGLSLTADKGLLERGFAKHQIETAYNPNQFTEDLYNEYSNWYGIYNHGVKSGDKAVVISAKKELIDTLKLAGTDVSKLKKIPSPQEITQNLEKVLNNIADKGEKPPFARVFPKFGGIPKEKILPAWKAPETEWSQKIIKDAYIESLPKEVQNNLKGKLNHIKQIYKDKPLSLQDTMTDKPNVKELLETHHQDMVVRYGGSQEPYLSGFNKRISENLQKKGYKALMYSPARYNEYEMRMLNPDDVVMLDMRKQSDPALKRMTADLKHVVKEGEQPRKGKQKKRLERWEQQATPREGASLGDIYKTITWDDIDRVLNKKSLISKFHVEDTNNGSLYA